MLSTSAWTSSWHDRSPGKASTRTPGCSGDIAKKVPLGLPNAAIAVGQMGHRLRIRCNSSSPSLAATQRRHTVHLHPGWPSREWQREAPCTYARSRVVMSVQTVRPTASRQWSSRITDAHRGWTELLSSDIAEAAAVSRAKKAPTSPIALISGAGNTTVVFLSTPNSIRVCRLRSCRPRGGPSWCPRHHRVRQQPSIHLRRQ